MYMILQKWDKCEIHREEQMFKFQSSKNVLVFVLLDEDEIRTIIEYLPKLLLVLFGIKQHSNPREVDYLYTNGSKSCMWRTSFCPIKMKCVLLQRTSQTSFLPSSLQNWAWVRFIVLTFNNISVISWRSVLLVEETAIPGENHSSVARHQQTLSHNVASGTPLHEQDSQL